MPCRSWLAGDQDRGQGRSYNDLHRGQGRSYRNKEHQGPISMSLFWTVAYRCTEKHHV